ncbi:hypothetical protein ACTFIW_008739 [Dictyostelium discoideum]
MSYRQNLEEVSIDIAQKRFPGRDLKNEKLPLVAIHSKRETEDLSPSGTHGFIDLYIPIPEKLGVYNLISPRKYGDSFLLALNQTEFTFSPREIGNLIQRIIKSFQMIFSTQKGIYFLVDQNNYMSHRYHKEIDSIPISSTSSTVFGAKKAVANKDADDKDIKSSLSDNLDWKNTKLHLPANIFKSEVVKTFLDSIKKINEAN